MTDPDCSFPLRWTRRVNGREGRAEVKSFQNVCRIFWPLGNIFVCTKMGEGWDWAILSTPLDVPPGQKPICFTCGGGGGGWAYISCIICRRDIVVKKPNTKTATCMHV